VSVVEERKSGECDRRGLVVSDEAHCECLVLAGK